MTTVPATGQFGPPLFSVLSKKGVVVGAKWLTDSTGASYIIDPNTGRPEQEQADMQALDARLSNSGNIRDTVALYNARRFRRQKAAYDQV